jgi:hypothetical protein
MLLLVVGSQILLLHDAAGSQIFFYSLIVFGGSRAPLLYLFSSAAPQRTAYSGVSSQMAAHPRIGSPL